MGVILALGFVQIVPCLLVTCEDISGILLGVSYCVLLVWFWSSTIIGRAYFKAFYACTLRLERALLGKCCDAR